MMHLSDYLCRIHYAGPTEPTYAVLRDVHRAHLLAISYENLDIHLGRPLSLEIAAIYDKIVRRRRGGWCFEMNGLLAWALREIGFEVQLVGSTVNHGRMSSSARDDHLVLLVKLDQMYVADAGFGNAFLDPLPLAEGEHVQNGFHFRLTREGAFWIFHNHAFGGAGYEFNVAPRRIDEFAERCAWLQTSPESGFVRVTVCHRFTPAGYLTLRGCVLQTVTPSAVQSRTIEDIHDYRAVLRDQFDLDLGIDIDRLWLRVQAGHQAWLRANPT